MAIDWKRVETRPEKEVKVMGQVLLDFREKVLLDNALIKQLKAENERLCAENDQLKGNLLVHVGKD